ncbi:hypothetical protein QWJ34_24830 [Saccharibacillus sp. CPCC 101409]|uniref:hypothetical protein n=1 Tax=Saccharibacillus sp. CPCC 101409 TaxID=3058041 RepID=UPI00267286E2|nr:hypothetical protein [Saccharibacillus sp. CPCC 101409]MDO3413012.1 hypothetical protein [Saccharibacillus sp. CPCC 101409]
METKQREHKPVEYTVEYQDVYGVLYFTNVYASDTTDAKSQVLRQIADAKIRAVTIVEREADGSTAQTEPDAAEETPNG